MNTAEKFKLKPAKYQLIVETATDLFMRFGIKRVTVEEICRTAQISKMTFYKYFNNKTDLAEYIIFSILENAQIEFDSIWKQLSTFDHKINQFIKLKMYYAKKFSKEFFIEYMSLSPKIHERVMDYSKKSQISFIKMIEQAQNSGSVRSDVSINFITFMFNHTLELVENNDLYAMYNNLEDLTHDMINFYFYGIMGKTK
ncbi:MAG: TetR/AcrR family transcriptional regulator [Candidatus Marinimicrobia bacterium]|nr:TetR/AcrR family transcriptional regulator [Candidatus Neomarinimicrobiota bacterium]